LTANGGEPLTFEELKLSWSVATTRAIYTPGRPSVSTSISWFRRTLTI